MLYLHMHVKHEMHVAPFCRKLRGDIMIAMATKKRKPRPQFFRQWREHLKLTQNQALDRLAGWDQSKISRVESGETMWNGYDLADLEAAYGLDAEWLLNVDPTNDPKLVDIVKLINSKNRDLAIRILQQLPPP